MVVKKKKTKKDPSWDKIGQTIGKKVEKEIKNDNCCSTTSMACTPDCSFIGRLIFFIGICLAFGYLGWLVAIPWWVLVISGIGFTLLKF
ncbi:hypothetical protein HOD38_00370 [archaeon]|jgi:hypothetical protein|nr:hypothetical protein [archaeon]MBT4396701.1 hypothetical protein [archaeon]MBT4441311.1 hypothetical protein [archaeon]